MELKSKPRPDANDVSQILERSCTQAGRSLVELSAESPVLLIFLRHAGCSFCRETLADVAVCRSAIEGQRTRIILVHMGDATELDALLVRYGLLGVDRISDPRQDLYGVFGLKRGSFRQLFGWKVLRRGIFGGVVLRYGIGLAHADASQLPGAFLIDRCAIVRRFRHHSAADRPDYVSLCTPSSSPSEIASPDK